MIITSSAFQEGQPIPKKYAYNGVAGGKNASLPLSWKEVPPGTKSFALSLIDPHPVARNWVHWFVINIPRDVTELHEGASHHKMPQGSVELYNTYGELGYGGPEPPAGSGVHPYIVTLYALNVSALELPEKATLPAFTNALEGKVIATAAITGTYERL